jgi:cell division transport system ATP-binding protein
MILFSNITKKYGKVTVLEDVNFMIRRGEFVSIVGSSGAGKTTLINAIIGAEKLTKGSVLMDNFNVTHADPGELQEYRRRVGMVFQDYKLLPQKTVFENVAFALEVCGYETKDVKKYTTEALKRTGLENHRNQYPRQLSGGEKQRTAIARALVHAPTLIIADEPTGNLDEDNSKQVIDLLLKLNEEGTTVILATHDKKIVNRIKQRVIIIEKGKIKSDKQNAIYD